MEKLIHTELYLFSLLQREEDVWASISRIRNLFCKCLFPIVDFHSLTILRVLSKVFAAGCCWEATRVISESTDYTSRLIGRIPQIPSQNPLMVPWRRLPCRSMITRSPPHQTFLLYCWPLYTVWLVPDYVDATSDSLGHLAHPSSPTPMDTEYHPSGRTGTWINDEEEDCKSTSLDRGKQDQAPSSTIFSPLNRHWKNHHQ